MGLSGVNKVCAQCIKECKQWKQAKIIFCPFFISTQKKNDNANVKNLNPTPNKHKEIAET
jgi:hypothetical protein